MELHAGRLKCLNETNVSLNIKVFLPEVERAVYLGGGGEGVSGGQIWAQEILAGCFHTPAVLVLPSNKY